MSVVGLAAQAPGMPAFVAGSVYVIDCVSPVISVSGSMLKHEFGWPPLIWSFHGIPAVPPVPLTRAQTFSPTSYKYFGVFVQLFVPVSKASVSADGEYCGRTFLDRLSNP